MHSTNLLEVLRRKFHLSRIMMTVRAICQPKPDLECGATAVEERRSRMGEQRTSRMERILRRVEEHVEDWRSRDAARQSVAGPILSASRTRTGRKLGVA